MGKLIRLDSEEYMKKVLGSVTIVIGGGSRPAPGPDPVPPEPAEGADDKREGCATKGPA